MTGGSGEDHWEAELRMLRQEIQELRAEQKEMANAINQLVTTFRALATHLGIASEPYARKGGHDRDLPGFA
jgi:phage shock protein A